MMYWTIRSSFFVVAKRKEKGLRRNEPTLATRTIVSLPDAAALPGRPVRGACAPGLRRCRLSRADRALDRAQGRRGLGRGPRGQPAAPDERGAPARRLPLRGLRDRGCARRRQRGTRGRRERL